MIDYRISLADLHAHLYELTLTVAAPQAQQVFTLPVWIPGSYMVREFSRHLGTIEARQGGRVLRVEQLDKCRWRVDAVEGDALELRYQVYAFDTSVRTAYLDAQRGFFNASSLCLRAEGFEAQPQRLTLQGLPQGWSAATAMASASEGPEGLSFVAAHYDELIDHPFELGPFWRGQFEARGVPHEFVVAGALPVFDGDRLLRDAQRICEAQIDFWHGAQGRQRASEPPFARYVFLLNAVEDGYGGLEHRASTALIASRRDLPHLGQSDLSDGYVRLLGLISHEYFHTWNVKRLRPADFAAFDYGRENYTELLWLFEGFTSYYDELFLVRAGLIDEARYLKLQSSNINSVLSAPGRLRQSVAQSSFEAWTKYYRPDENSPNALVSYYLKGGLLAMALDLSLRQLAGPARSLDQLMRLLWQRSPEGLVSEALVLQLLTELADEALAQQLSDWVHGTADLPLAPLLEAVGVRWGADKLPLAQRLGLRVQDGAGGLRIKNVLSGGAGLQAGLCAGDELLASNGWRIKKLDELLLTVNPNAPDRLTLLVAREQRVLSLELRLPPSSSGEAPVLLSVADKAVARSIALRRAWLGTH